MPDLSPQSIDKMSRERLRRVLKKLAAAYEARAEARVWGLPEAGFDPWVLRGKTTAELGFPYHDGLWRPVSPEVAQKIIFAAEAWNAGVGFEGHTGMCWCDYHIGGVAFLVAEEGAVGRRYIARIA